jgi:hypothetical protein
MKWMECAGAFSGYIIRVTKLNLTSHSPTQVHTYYGTINVEEIRNFQEFPATYSTKNFQIMNNRQIFFQMASRATFPGMPTDALILGSGCNKKNQHILIQI